MTSILRYGADAQVQLDIPPEVLVANCDAPRGTPIADVAHATREALAAPLEYPALSQAMVPGDHVALALDYGVPQSAKIVATVIDVLLAAGIEPFDISVVRTLKDVDNGVENPLSAVPEELRDHIQLVTHDPQQRDRLSYLAASDKAKAIYVNRAIHDADLVLPIGCLRSSAAPDYFGINAGVYPTFADAKSQERYRSPRATASRTLRRKLRKQADDASWLLGAVMTLQVVPGPGDQLLHVLAGHADAVVKYGQALYDAAWSFAIPRRASLVIAAIGGDSRQQTWENFGRALDAAGDAVAANGAIALCTDLAAALGPAFMHLAHNDDIEEATRQILKARPADALPATQLMRAVEQNKVYLLSRLEHALVEELGLAAVTRLDQIARLATHHDSCILLANAQYIRATAAEETN